MKTRYALLTTAVTFLSAAGFAQASTLDLGMVGPGTHNVPTITGSGSIDDVIEGILSAGETITFDYTLTGFTPTSLTSSGTYGYKSFDFGTNTMTRYKGASSSYATPGFSTVTGSEGSTNPVGHPNKKTYVNSLVFTDANLSTTSGTATITNNSLGNVSFTATLLGKLKKLGGSIVTSFTVSNVPLPSSASLFGLGLAMFAGLGLMKKKQQA